MSHGDGVTGSKRATEMSHGDGVTGSGGQLSTLSTDSKLLAKDVRKGGKNVTGHYQIKDGTVCRRGTDSSARS